MEPGRTPRDNARFMTFLAAVVRAISVHGDILRVAIATPGNDFRLGMNEAPPAIISTYVGDQLWDVIQDMVAEPSAKLQRMPSKMQLGVNSLPTLPRDSSDRNRTSPFAFTGNKFEFRAVGSSQSCARPAMMLNCAVADSLHWLADEIESELKKGMKPELAVHAVVTRTLKAHRHAIFNGNGYSEEWRTEAEERGLLNLRTTPEAIKLLSEEKNLAVFENLKVLTRREVLSTQTIMFDHFIKTVAIEAECLTTMATSHVLPASFQHKQRIAASVDKDQPLQMAVLNKLNSAINDLLKSLEDLNKQKEAATKFHEDQLSEQSVFYRQEVMTAMAATRTACDTLETMVDDSLWPFPKYSEILLLK